MYLNFLDLYLIRFDKNRSFCNAFDFFCFKIKYMDEKKCLINKLNNINLIDNQYNGKLIDYGINDKNYIMVRDRNRYIFNLLINLCMRNGNKNLAYKNVKKSFILLRKFFWINAMFFIRLILVQSESLFIIQKYIMGKREKVIPRFIPFEKKTKFVLRMLVKYARTTQKEYKYFYISLANAIIEYSLPNNILMEKNREDNQLAELNKFFLFKKKKKEKKCDYLEK